MNDLRLTISNLFETPIQNMTYVAYFQFVNSSGKITARSLMDLVTILLTHAEEQERKMNQYDQNFVDIEEILAKLVDNKVVEKVDEPPPVPREDATTKATNEAFGFNCATCGKTLSTKLALAGHSRSHKSK